MVTFSIAIGAPFQYDVLGEVRVMVVVAVVGGRSTRPHAKWGKVQGVSRNIHTIF